MRLAEPKHHNTENQNEDGHYEEWSCLSESARGVVGSHHHQVPGDVSGEETAEREKCDDINRSRCDAQCDGEPNRERRRRCHRSCSFQRDATVEYSGLYLIYALRNESGESSVTINHLV